MAAGYGKQNVTDNSYYSQTINKSNGISMIETIIQALLKNEIEEIYIVVGYLKSNLRC